MNFFRVLWYIFFLATLVSLIANLTGCDLPHGPDAFYRAVEAPDAGAADGSAG